MDELKYKEDLKLSNDKIKFIEQLKPYYDLINSMPTEKLHQYIQQYHSYDAMMMRKYYVDNLINLPNTNFYKKEICLLLQLLGIKVELF